jgi:hypothetical protein
MYQTTTNLFLGDKVTTITKNIFLRGQPNWKLRDRQLGPFTVKDHTDKHRYKLKLLAAVRLHPVFHVNNLMQCHAASLRLVVPVTTP